MTPLLTVIAYHKGDLDAATRLLNWIRELDTPPDHCCLLVADSAIAKSDRDILRDNAARSFRHVSSFAVSVPAVGFAPNHMFLSAAKQIQYGYKLSWLWLEPDCVPLTSSWLDKLASAYETCPKKFMGQLVHSDQPGLPAVHLTGCSIYSPDAFEDVFNRVESLKGQNVAWDIECAALATPRAQHTDLIQHHYGEAGWPPTFVMNKIAGQEYAKNVVDLSFIRPSATIFHRCKDDSLINMLRLRLQTEKFRTTTPKLTHVETLAKRRPGRPRKEEPVTVGGVTV